MDLMPDVIHVGSPGQNDRIARRDDTRGDDDYAHDSAESRKHIDMANGKSHE